MQHQLEHKTINAIVVDDDVRCTFLFNTFGTHSPFVGKRVRQLMDTFSKDYGGGCWDTIALSNGGAYLRLRSSGDFHLYIDRNGFSRTFSADAAGIVVSLIVFQSIAATTDAQWAIQMQRTLLEFASAHVEAHNIFQAIQ